MAERHKHLTSIQIQQALADTAATLPIFPLLEGLFTDPEMFNSYARFEKAGFSLVAHSPHKILTGSHPRIRGYLFKKYNNEKACKKQLRNYMHRLEGARLLREFISVRGFQWVTVPEKWLFELPTSFPARYMVVAKKIDLSSREEAESSYARISKNQMEELATVLFYFRGLNSTVQNLPYTKDKKIAFVDTERWHREKDFLRKVKDRIPRDRCKQAEALFEKLHSSGERPFQTTFK